MPPAQPVFMRTKSGTKVYLTDNTVSMIEQKRALSTFIKIYNNSFTIEEQKKIGNIIYHYNKQGKQWSRIATLPKGTKDSDVHAAHTSFTDSNIVKKLNPGNKKMTLVTFSKDSYNNEPTVVHEIIHCRDEMIGKYKTGLKNEQQTDFETVGRISKNGLKQQIKKPHGYYIYDKKIIKEKNFISRIKATKSAILQDRKLLTGSLNTNITGKVASTRAKTLFGKSFFGEK